MRNNFLFSLLWVFTAGVVGPILAILGVLSRIPLTLIYGFLVWISFCALKKIEMYFQVQDATTIRIKSTVLGIFFLLASFHLWRIFFLEFLSLFFADENELILLLKFSEDILLSIGFSEGVLIWGYLSLTYGKHHFSRQIEFYLRWFSAITMSLLVLTTLKFDEKWLKDVVGYY